MLISIIFMFNSTFMITMIIYIYDYKGQRIAMGIIMSFVIFMFICTYVNIYLLMLISKVRELNLKRELN